MGSFNATCGLSGLPITSGDRAAFVPLASSRFKVPSIGPLHTDTCQYFAPILPPITGTYDGYGRLGEVEASPVTALVEKTMNRPIDEAMNVLTDSRCLYDSFSEAFPTYVTSPGHLAGYGIKTGAVLESIGFTHHETPEGGEHTFNGAAITTRNGHPTGIRVGNTTTALGQDATQLDTILSLFARTTGTYPGVAEADVPAAHLANTTTGMFVHPEVLEGVAATMAGDLVFNRPQALLGTEWDTLQERIAAVDPPSGTPVSSWWDIRLTEMLRHYTSWEPEQFEYLRHLDQESVLAMMHVVDVAGALGRTLGPTMTLGEGESHEPARALHRICSDILTRHEEEGA